MGLFSFGKSAKPQNSLNWTIIQSLEELEDAIKSSSTKPALFFKHSTRCSISSMALNRFENGFTADDSRYQLYFIDLIAHRNVSNAIAETLNVVHQSPQVIILNNHEVIYTASHTGIDAHKIESLL